MAGTSHVAISRAQTLAIVVANPAIGLVSTPHVEQLRRVSLFNALMAEGHRGF